MNCEHRHVPREEYGAGTAEVVNLRSGSEAHEGLGEFLDRLDEDEDVHKVYHNAILVQFFYLGPNAIPSDVVIGNTYSKIVFCEFCKEQS